jgi:hypothetical protein
MFAAVAGALWKCHYGIEFFDEAFYLPPGFKMFGLGDRPFLDEINNGPRQLDILNYLLVRSIVPFSVVILRMAAVIFYAAALLSLTLVSFGANFGLMAALVFSGLVSFDYLLVTTWSHNHWCRDWMVWHTAFLLAASKTQSQKKRPLMMAAAGGSLAFAVIAYNTVIAAAVLGFAVVVLLAVMRHKINFKTSWLPYALAFAVIFGADIIYCLRPDVWPYLKQALAATRSVPDYAMNSNPLKALQIILFALGRVELWFCLLAVALWKLPASGRIYCLVGIALITLCARLCYTPEIGARALSAWIGIGLAGGLFAGWQAWTDRNSIRLVASLVPLAVIFVMGMSSSGANFAMVWAAPALIVPFIAAFANKPCVIGKFPKPATLLILGVLALATLGSVVSELTKTYHDAPPKDCTATVNFAPLRGIKTAPRRAFLLDRLNELAAPADFGFTDGALPILFLLGNVRSSLNTIFLDERFSSPLKEEQLRQMISRKRFPTLLIHPKRNPWEWGIGVTEVFYDPKETYHQFYECAKTKLLGSYFEFDAYATDEARVRKCLAFYSSRP